VAVRVSTICARLSVRWPSDRYRPYETEAPPSRRTARVAGSNLRVCAINPSSDPRANGRGTTQRDGETAAHGRDLARPGLDERVGPFLDNTVKVIEIKGYLADGSVGFHAFNVISFDSEEKKEYVINARAGGRSGAFSFKLAPGGFVWNIGEADSGLRYTATFKDGTWTEKGESLAPGRPATTVSEFTLQRIGDTDWPEAGAVPPR
jgi:hypothetical protein